MLGYENVGYRILIKNKVIIARHVDVIEEDTNLIGFKCDDEENNPANEAKESPRKSRKITEDMTNKNNLDVVNDRIFNDQAVQSQGNREEDELRGSMRERKKSERYGDNVAYSSCIYINFVSVNTPTSFENALKSKESGSWRQAIVREIDGLRKNKTWELVQRPIDKKVLDVKWIYRNKSNDKKKARFVVREFQ